MVSHANAVFYATTYHPIQAGSIDGTHISAHDNAVHRALLATTTGLYDPLKDPKAKGDPYCSLYIGRLSAQTDENSLREAMSRFGQVKNLRLVRHIVTGASCGYAFVEFERERDMRHAYESAHQLRLDGASILVDYNRQQLMPGWIPRRLGGGLGGKKESGQLRFGGRDRPFRAPLPPIPREKLMKLGIPLPPEGRYMSRFQVPPPPQRKRTADDVGTSESKHRRVHSVEDEDSKERTSYEEHGSEAGEGRDSYLHRRRKDEFRDRVDRGRHHEAESRSHYRKHEGEEEEEKEEERGQESRRESRYEGFEFEPKRQSSREGRDAEDTRHGGERAERKRRKEYSNERHEYEDEGLTRQGRWKPEDDLQQSRVSRDTDVGDAHDRHHESRHRSKGHRQASRENDRKHRQSDSKHRRRDEDEDRAQRSSRKHKHHRDRSAGEDRDGEEKERKRSKHREHDI